MAYMRSRATRPEAARPARAPGSLRSWGVLAALKAALLAFGVILLIAGHLAFGAAVLVVFAITAVLKASGEIDGVLRANDRICKDGESPLR